ncbi:MAG: hypothetical protein ACXWLH_04345 [Candidatus Saccharimonadales bacterium]
MSRNQAASLFIDRVLELAVGVSALSAGLLVPNALVALDKPIKKFFKGMEQKDRQREARRLISYMKSQGLLVGEYEHGLKITKKGRQRLTEVEFENLQIPTQKKWDHIWRLVFYDIPEVKRSGRESLTNKLRGLGFFQLQQSVWIHPLPCREVIEKITSIYKIEQFVSYIETPHLENESALIKKFNKRLLSTSFK